MQTHQARLLQLPALCFQSRDVIENLGGMGMVGEGVMENTWLSLYSGLRNTSTTEGQLPTFPFGTDLGLWEKADSGEGQGPLVLSLSRVGFSSSGQQTAWPLTVSLNSLHHLAASENSFYILAIQFSFLCCFWVLFFLKCVVICMFSGKFGEVEAGASSQGPF